MAIEELVTLMDPVSTVPLPQQQPEYYLFDESHPSQKATLAAEEAKTKLSIPKELWRLVDALWSGNALKEKGLFNTPADALEVAAIRQALDEGLDFAPSASPHDIVACLLGLLSSMPRPLLPPALYPTSKVDATSLSMASRKFLEDLPPLHYNVFVYLISFFREVLAEEAYNRCSAAHLAEVCIESMTTNILFSDELTTASGGSGSGSGIGSGSGSGAAASSGGAATAATGNSAGSAATGASSSAAVSSSAASSSSSSKGLNAIYYDDVVLMTKEEKLRRIERQSYLYDIVEFLLTTPNL